jgi:uncharacterized NAD-dependent epimerase/dehydratase family protein
MIIAVLDSGYSGLNIERILGGISISMDGDKAIFDKDYSDVYGHGTAVTDLLMSQCSENVNFFVVRILDKDGSCSSGILYRALQYIFKNIHCDLIHISAGVERLENSKELYEIIGSMLKNKEYIVAAFANSGSVSYPAAFDNVLGVDISSNSLKKEQYEAVEGSIVDYRTSSRFYRVNWLGKTVIVNGSSFSSTAVTAKAGAILVEKCIGSLEELKDELRKKAVSIYEYEKYPQLVSARQMSEQIKKAIVFPFNKEVFQIAGNEEMCDFEIVGYYSFRYDFNLNKRISDVLTYSENEKFIKDIMDVDWGDDFDTVILGHCNDVSKSLRKDVIDELLSCAKRNNKKVYSLADISSYIKKYPGSIERFTFPYIDISDLPKNHFGKLRKTSKPVVSVCGTSSKQGKFHVQLALRKRFLNDGYKPYQISTEPTGYLFGMDKVFPIGFESTFYLSEQDAVITMNDSLFEAEMSNADLILIGSQSGTIPHHYDNTENLTIQQTELLMAVNPDAVIICINYDDDDSYIERTKKYIESISVCKVVGMCMLPVKYERKINTLSKLPLDKAEILKRKADITEKFGLDLYIIGESSEMDNLYNAVIGFFGQ